MAARRGLLQSVERRTNHAINREEWLGVARSRKSSKNRSPIETSPFLQSHPTREELVAMGSGKTCIAPRRSFAVAVNVALVPGGSRMNRMCACDAVRRAAGPHRQVQPFLSGCGLGSRWISLSIDQLCVRSRSDSTLRGELPTARCGPRITFVSSKWTTRKLDQVPNTEAFANLPQLGSNSAHNPRRSVNIVLSACPQKSPS